MRKLYVRGFFLLLAAVMLISASACGGKESGVYDLNDHAFTLSQLSGKDALGREISPAGASAEKKYVGVYYFPWFDRIHYDNVYDISEIMAKYEKSVGDPTNPLWALDGAYYDPSVSPSVPSTTGRSRSSATTVHPIRGSCGGISNCCRTRKWISS